MSHTVPTTTLTMMGTPSVVPAVQLFHPPRRNAVRVRVRRGDEWVDITNRVHQGQVRHNNDDPVALLDLTLLNGAQFPTLAPRVKTSAMNRDANDNYAPLLDRYNEIMVEAAISTDGSEPTDFVPVFHGLLGDSIRTEHDAEAGVVIHLQARDLAKRLQDDLIREPITYRDMYASQIIQALLDERFGEGAITLNGLGVDDFYIDEVTFEYVDTWQAIQSFCEQSDKDVRYMLDEGTGEFLLTYWTPSTAMVPVWSINASDIIRESLETSDASLRHGVEVRYIDANGERQSEYVEDLSNKKPNEPLRVALIEEGDTSAIRDQAAALRFANAVLSALKTVPATDSLQVPFTPYMRIYDVIHVTNTGVRSEPELYAIDELRLNFSAEEWWTEVVASESVKVRHEVWLEKEAKKGVKAPFTPADLATKRSVLTPEPGDWEVRRVAGGIEVRWAKPLTPYWDYTEVHLSRSSGFDPTGWDGSAWTSPPNVPGEFDGNTKTLIGTSKGQSLPITAGVVYRDTWYVKIVHVDTSGNRSAGSVVEKSISVGSPRGALVVAAADASAYWKTIADIVCDGEEDQVDINHALSVADRVELSEGTFVVKGSTDPFARYGAIMIPSGKSILGQGDSTVIKLADGHNGIARAIVPETDVVSGVRVSSIKIDGNRDNQNPGGETEGIIGDFTDSTFDHVTVENAVAGSISIFHASHGNRIVSCRVSNSAYGPVIRGSDNTVQSCVVENNETNGISLSGGNTVTGNVSSQNGLVGIQIIGDESVVTGNVCYGNGTYGISIGADASDNTVVGNTCTANGQLTDNLYANIIVSGNNNNVQGNTCRVGSLPNQPRRGIWISSVATGNFVSNNDLRNSGKTISIEDQGTGTITVAGNAP